MPFLNQILNSVGKHRQTTHPRPNENSSTFLIDLQEREKINKNKISNSEIQLGFRVSKCRSKTSDKVVWWLGERHKDWSDKKIKYSNPSINITYWLLTFAERRVGVKPWIDYRRRGRHSRGPFCRRQCSSGGNRRVYGRFSRRCIPRRWSRGSGRRTGWGTWRHRSGRSEWSHSRRRGVSRSSHRRRCRRLRQGPCRWWRHASWGPSVSGERRWWRRRRRKHRGLSWRRVSFWRRQRKRICGGGRVGKGEGWVVVAESEALASAWWHWWRLRSTMLLQQLQLLTTTRGGVKLLLVNYPIRVCFSARVCVYKFFWSIPRVYISLFLFFWLNVHMSCLALRFCLLYFLFLCFLYISFFLVKFIYFLVSSEIKMFIMIMKWKLLSIYLF